MGALKKHKMRHGGYSGRPANPTARAASVPHGPPARGRVVHVGPDYLLSDPGLLAALLRPFTPRIK